ncbi:hypothetical protein BGW36DRAFT_366223 [Talaromyces proteolyticus]|uniref:Uncharacterized protein n=1 Tax=Talaromyces proteolyticus TaxID=1131652 RepID=A0AAD4L6H5_9EURO|nr:uncharacterized protein BGW36DRAFT_366223 [Talaromyces proteolyticus]KAH8704824.1 hypothetical protein BGW36DRAFT_366223 [Talaromyces proteolyticus]
MCFLVGLVSLYAILHLLSQFSISFIIPSYVSIPEYLMRFFALIQSPQICTETNHTRPPKVHKNGKSLERNKK